MHIPKEHRTKLDDKSMKCIFLGYVDGEFGYRLWDPVKHKVIRSRDVIFNELQMFKKFAGDIEVKKIVDKFADQREDIPFLQEHGQPPLQEHGHQIQEHDGHQVEDNE